MKGGEIGKWKRHKNTPQSTKASGKATGLISEMLLSPLNHASLRVKTDVFCVFLNGFGYTCEALFVLHAILFQLQSVGICAVFQATN